MKIGDVEVPPNRHRGLREAAVLGLMESMSEIGQLAPIVVSRGGLLVAGLHRLEAAKRLGWSEIDARFVDLDELQAEMAEIDENLIRSELTVLERGEHLARRKEIYEALHPQARHGGDRRSDEAGSKRKDFVSFAADTAAKAGVSERTVQHEVQIATAIADDVKDEIRGTPIADRKADLIELSRMEPEEQRAAVEKARATGEPIAKPKPKPRPKPPAPEPKDDGGFGELCVAWETATAEARQRFTQAKGLAPVWED